MKKRWQLVLKISISLGLIALVLYFVDFQEMLTLIQHADLRFLLAEMGIILLDRVLMAYKWNLLLRAVGIQLPLFFLVRVYTISTLSGVLLPSNLGGDLFRLYSLSRRDKMDNKAVLASMIVERILAFLAMLILATFSMLLASYLMRDSWGQFSGIWLAIGIGGLAVIALLIPTSKTFRGWIDRLATRFTRFPLVSKIYNTYLLSYEYRNHLRTVTVVAAWTLLEQLMPVVGIALTVRALHLNVSFIELVAIIPIIVLASRLPISLDGYGVTEGLYVILFGLVGVSASQAFSLSIVDRILPHIFALPWGIHYVLTRGRRTVVSEKYTTPAEPISNR